MTEKNDRKNEGRFELFVVKLEKFESESVYGINIFTKIKQPDFFSLPFNYFPPEKEEIKLSNFQFFGHRRQEVVEKMEKLGYVFINEESINKQGKEKELFDEKEKEKEKEFERRNSKFSHKDSFFIKEGKIGDSFLEAKVFTEDYLAFWKIMPFLVGDSIGYVPDNFGISRMQTTMTFPVDKKSEVIRIMHNFSYKYLSAEEFENLKVAFKKATAK
jgi:hypothetical protein